MTQNKAPMISVIMSVYNTEPAWLRAAVESILSQTYRDFEFLIVLDCPTDGSEGIILEYAQQDPRIHVLRNEKNLGLTRSLNRALSQARGRYIARMDADDVSLPQRLERQTAYMDTHPEAAVAGARTYTPGSDLLAEAEHPSDPSVFPIRMLFYNAGIPHPTAFIRRSVLQEHGLSYDEQFRKSQDYKLWIDIMPHGHIVMLPEVLLMYRVHSGQISDKPTEQLNYVRQAALGQAKRLLGNMTEAEEALHAELCGNDTTQSKQAYKRYLRRLLTANREKKLYDQKKLARELDYIWCQKAWRRAVLLHRFDFALDMRTLAMLRPSVLRYILADRRAKADYLAAVHRAQEEYREMKV